MSSPAVSGGVIYVGSYDGDLYALNASDGMYVWSYLTGDWVVSSPAVANDVVYVGSYDNMIYAFGAPQTQQKPNTTFAPSILLIAIPLIVITALAILFMMVYYKKKLRR